MRRVAVALVICWSIVASSPAWAFVPHVGNVVVLSEPIRDDVYISGGTVQSGAAVDGDLVVAGGTVTATGPVTGSVLAAGGTLTFAGMIGRTLRAAGGTLNITNRIGSDAVLAGGTIDLAHNAEIGRDLVLAAGTMQVSGTVQRNAFLSGGQVYISGTIFGNTDVRASHVVLLPTARLQGRLRYTADTEAEIQQGAQVLGGVTRLSSPATQRVTSSYWSRPYLRLVVGILEALWLLTLGLVAVALAPRRVASVADYLRRQFAASLLVGLVLLIVVPVVVIFLIATVVGLSLSVITMLLYLTTLYPGLIFTAAWLGEAIITGWQRRATGTSPYLVITVGVIVLVILFALPWLGWIFRCLAILAGFGAFWATWWNARNQAPGPVVQA